MKHSLWAVAVLLLSLYLDHGVDAKAVFAHFMVDNANGWDQSQWESEMALALTAKIDAFALNIAAAKDYNSEQIQNAFAAASSVGFQVFFSFDYAGNGAWAMGDVLNLLGQYSGSGVYFRHEGTLPLVSTFEGPDNAADWVSIKSAYDIFFIPDWSSRGAEVAVTLEGGVADGLFSWAAWSYGGLSMDTYTDASYIQFLNGKPYMMAASPWFYTNLPEYNKNWMWPDYLMSLWPDRWTQILWLQPDYVEIISWNDYGESHYIGPNHPSPPFEDGNAVYDYVTNVDHDPWRWPLAVWAEQYKSGIATVTEESVVLTYLPNDVDSCNDGSTPINTATQLQYEYFASSLLINDYKHMGFIATLKSPANLTIMVGDTPLEAVFLRNPPGDAGVYYGFAFVGDATGDVQGSLSRDGAVFLTATGPAIGGCTDGYANFNPYAAGAVSAPSTGVSTQYHISDLVCTEGTGSKYYDEDFASICSVTCEYGYCPSTACVCRSLGLQKPYPAATGIAGYAKTDANFVGLCSWTYEFGFADIFTDQCTTVETSPPVNPTSPFLPPACIAGEIISDSDYYIDDLCEWTCAYGYCPIHACTCTTTGQLVPVSSADTSSVDLQGVYPEDGNPFVQNVCDWPCDVAGLCVCDLPDSFDCDLDQNFTDLDVLLSASDSYADYCNQLYVLDFLSSNMTDVLSDYNSDVSNGYEDYFDQYVVYVKEEVPYAIQRFMEANGTDYFSCEWDDGNTGCPKWSSLTSANDYDITVTWHLEDSDGYNAILSAVYGVNSSWITLGTSSKTPNAGCPPELCQSPQYTWTFNNYPVPIPDDEMTVYNPASVFTSAGAGFTNLPTQIQATYLDILFGQWGNGSAVDVIQVYALATSSAAQALAAMAQVESIAKEIKEEEDEAKKRNIILWIVTAVLFVVPWIGEELAAAVDFTALARGLAMAGVAGNFGLDVFSIVEQPDSAYMVVMGWLVGAGGAGALARDADSFAQMAAKRESEFAELTRMGSYVEDTARDIQKIAKTCNL